MTEITRRRFLQYGAGAGAGLILWRFGAGGPVLAMPIPGGTLDPTSVPKYETPLVIPPAMPRTDPPAGTSVDYYEIGVRQFQQHILPQSMGLPPTTVWSYGSVNHPGTFNYPAFTIEATYTAPVRVNWMNQLVDTNGNYLRHLLPIDQTLHWANPPGGPGGTDMEAFDPTPYTGPVPIVTHLHGGHSGQESDGFPEAWFLPAANNIPAAYATVGSHYDMFKAEAEALYGQPWGPGTAVFQYPNDQAATTMWYHDHTLGMTRSNVYAGPAGFYLLRGGPGDAVSKVGGGEAVLPGPAPALGDPPDTKYYEIPIVVQDRSFNADASLFYPDNRAFFEGLDPSQLQIPFIPDRACPQLPPAAQGQARGRRSDISPIFNPEFFGNTMVVNGNTWPELEVEPRRYRFRFLNGCNSRFLILKLGNGLPFWQIGAEGGFLPAPVEVDQLLLGLAERADVIVDFTNVSVGEEIILENLAPDEPFGGGVPGVDFEPADEGTTGQVMRFKVVSLTSPEDPSTPPDELILPAPPPLPSATKTRQVSLNEEDSQTVRVRTDDNGNVVLDCAKKKGEPFGPRFALLGRVADGKGVPLRWDDRITESPAVGATEVWEMYNFTEDAHPIHIHEITFDVVNRESLETGLVRAPEPWESGRKDTVIAYPDEITRVKATFDRAGLFVWHCHIVEHEDHEMMRPYRIGR
jgi:FtsP/CotA-like multicopper oxidase with cupredoxin domain